MCDPVSLAIGGTTKVASNYFQRKAEKKVKRAREGVKARADADLAGYRDAARQNYRESLDSATPGAINAGMAAAEANRDASYQAAIQDAPTIVNENSSDAAKRAIIKAVQTGKVNSRELARRRAAVEGYGDAAIMRDITMGRAGQGIAQNADFARGRANVAELELEDANNAGRKYADIAGLIDGLGTIAGAAYGMYGGGTPGKIIYDAPAGPVSPRIFGPPAKKSVGYYKIGV